MLLACASLHIVVSEPFIIVCRHRVVLLEPHVVAAKPTRMLPRVAYFIRQVIMATFVTGRLCHHRWFITGQHPWLICLTKLLELL